MKAYFLSGVGADKRSFKYLTLASHIEPHYIEWLTPDKKESLSEYALRISAKIDNSRPFILVGLSFGGVLAIELLKFVRPQKTILISSIARQQELPMSLRLSEFFKLDKMIPPRAAVQPNFLTNWIFGVSTERDKLLLKEILSNANIQFSRWAIRSMLSWQRKETPKDIIRIHGDNDKLLPINNFRPDYLIKNGGHLMVATMAGEISQTLNMEMGFS